MATLVVEHRWKKKNEKQAFEVVGTIIDMAKNGKLPEGYKLISINVLKDRGTALCNWEAPSAEAMRQLLEKVKPPTKHTVYDSQKIF